MRLLVHSTRALMACGLLAIVTTPAAAQRGPAATPLQMDPQVLALACAPAVTREEPMAPVHVTGGQDSFKRVSYAPGDLVTINAGRQNGIEVGQEYYARRLQYDLHKPRAKNVERVIRTTGWLRVYAVDDTMSLATVTHACETIDIGDYLEPFALPTMPTVSAEPLRPEKGNYARVTMGTDRRRAFAKGDFFILDRGSNAGVTAGSRYVVFRDKLQYQNFLYNLGEAVVVDVKPDSATLQVTVSRDAFMEGDFAALRKDPVPAPPAR